MRAAMPPMTAIPPSHTPSSQETPAAQASAGTPAKRANSFTGERPGWGEGFDYDYARHLAAYQSTAGIVAGKSVLDAGCGEGFGTHTLAATAREVVGLDYSEDAIAECRRLWCDGTRPNLRFERVDLTRPADFNERFDVVLNFQVIEHIRQTGPFLRALREWLLPGGVLVLTTPNRLRTTIANPYHVREYTASELRAELSTVFSDVTIRGVLGNDKVERFEQRRARAVRNIMRLDPLGLHNLLPRSIVEFAFAKLARVVRRRARPAGAPLIQPENFSVRDDNIERAIDLLAICSGSAGPQ